MLSREPTEHALLEPEPIATDQYFQYDEPFPGVIVGVARPNAKVVCNATIIDLGGDVAVVDSHSRPSAARAVMAFVAKRFGTDVRYVINTHHHWDHCQGNAAYAQQERPAELIAHPNAIAAMRQPGPKSIAAQRIDVPDELAALRATLDSSSDATEDADRLSDVEDVQRYAAELDGIELAVPERAVAGELVIAGTRREIRICHPGPAHTSGDLIVQLPAESAVATGDCVIGWTPFMGDSHPGRWDAALDFIADGPSGTLLMGHGRPAGRDWLGLFHDYVRDVAAETIRRTTHRRPVADVALAVRDRLSDRYRPAFDREGGRHRLWDVLMLRNVERVHALVRSGAWDEGLAR